MLFFEILFFASLFPSLHSFTIKRNLFLPPSISFLKPLIIGYEIADLEFTVPSDFNQEAALWTATNNLNSQLTDTCAGTLLLGGYGLFAPPGPILRREYTDLPDHQGVMIKIEVWLIDVWTYYDTFIFIIGSADGTVFQGRGITIFYDETLWTGKLCGYGSAYDLKPVYLYISVAHSSSTLSIQLQSQSFDFQNTAVFGIRKVNVLLSQNYFGNGWAGTTTPPGLLFQLNANNGCPYGQYWNLLSCTGCDPACESCNGGGAGNCLSCSPYFSYNGQECVSCDLSCKSCSDNTNTGCVECYPGDFLYKNGTCMDHCNAPYAQRVNFGISYCDFPCADDDYIYPNLTCDASCPLPFKQRIQVEDHFCDYRCPTSEYIFPDLACDPTCSFPMIPLPIADIKVCNPPCVDDSSYYDPVHGTCNETCIHPYFPKALQYYTICRYIQPLTASSVVAVVSPMTSIVVVAASAILVGRTWGIMVITLARMLRYVKYINVDYLEYGDSMIEAWKAAYINMNFNIAVPESIMSKMPFEELNRAFMKFELPSSFLVNFWPLILIIFGALGGTILLALLEWIILKATADEKSLFYLGIQKLRVIAQNFFLMAFLSNCGEAIFYAILDFETVNGKESLPVFSLTTAIIFLCLVAGGAVLFLKFLIQQTNLREKFRGVKGKQQLREKLKSYQGIQILLFDFKMDSVGSQGFLLFFVMRDILYCILIALLPEYQIYQSVLILVLCITMLMYLISKRPFSSLINLVQQLFWEAFLLVYFAMSFIGAVLENINSQSDSSRTFIGKSIIRLEVVFNISVMVTFAFQVLKFGYEIYRYFYPKPQVPASSSLGQQITELEVNKKRSILGFMEEHTFRKQSLDGTWERSENSIWRIDENNDSMMMDRSLDTLNATSSLKKESELLNPVIKLSPLIKAQKLNPDDFALPPVTVKNTLQGKMNEKIAAETEKRNVDKIRKARATYSFRPKEYTLGMNLRHLVSKNYVTKHEGLEDSDGKVELRCKNRDQILKNLQKKGIGRKASDNIFSE